MIKPKRKYLISIAIVVILAQSAAIIYLWLNKDNKLYEVNLVKINTQKDTMDLRSLKEDLDAIYNTTNRMNAFLKDRNISTIPIQSLDIDSLPHRVYISNLANRYSQYLVDLEYKLQHTPLGMPSDGYISSNFGKRKNPIPVQSYAPTKKATTQQPPVANIVNNTPETPKRRKVIDAKIIEEKDSAGNIKKVVIPIYAKEETTIQRPETPKAAPIIPATKTNNIKNNNPHTTEPEQMQFHKGVDIALPMGSPIKCTASGIVIFSGEKGGYGNCIIISHGNGLATLYAHLSEVLVKTNQRVKTNQIIAKSGNSGRSTGPHLHYEIHRNNTPVNPNLFIIGRK